MMHVAELSMMKGIPSISKVTEGVLAAVGFVVASATDDGRGVELWRTCGGVRRRR
jgi:hypothetical protein